MELKQIRYFVKLAEILNFTEAADKLFITQSALSVSIKQLEEEIGYQLFDRIGKKIYLTDEGTVFLDYARSALENISNGVEEINAANHVFKGRLCIGVTYSTSSVLNACIIRYTEKYPDVQMTVMASTTVKELIDDLLSNRLDMAITYRPEKLPPLIEERILFKAPLSVIAHKNHPLASKKNITAREFADYPVITFLHDTLTQMHVDRFLEKNDLHIKPQMEVNDTNLILEMIQTGHWISALSPISIRNRADLKAIPFASKTEYITVSVLWLKGKSKQPLYRTLLDEITDSVNVFFANEINPVRKNGRYISLQKKV